MAHERRQFAARRHIPETNTFVFAAGSKPAPISAKRNCIKAGSSTIESAHLPRRSALVELDRLVGARGKGSAIGCEGDRFDKIKTRGVAGNSHFASRGKIPKLNYFVIARRKKLLTVAIECERNHGSGPAVQ